MYSVFRSGPTFFRRDGRRRRHARFHPRLRHRRNRPISAHLTLESARAMGEALKQANRCRELTIYPLSEIAGVRVGRDRGDVANLS